MSESTARTAAQEAFLRAGGPMSAVLEHKYETGELKRDYVYQAYPRMLKISKGVQTTKHRTDIVKGRDVEPYEWEETKERFEEVIVNSEEEEERVLTGGKSNAQVESERQELAAQCKARGIQVDATWGIVRLQRELGSAPTNETVDALRLKVQDLQEKAALRQKIADLEAQLAAQPAAATAPMMPPLASAREPVDETEALQYELRELGVEADGRWGLARLRQELHAARNRT